MRARSLLTGITVLPLAAVAAALYTQYRMDMMPCAWCVLQRLCFVVIAAAGLLGLLLPGAVLRRVAGVLALLGAAAGITAALWQHFVANASASCAMSLADRLMGFTGLDSRFPEVFAAYASCADAKVDLLGLPYEFWSLGLFIVLAIAALRVVLRPT
ncbi:MAG TPA: disulfide bond formation protein B [Aquabacterium sp.]|mgnify:CR=1 FL=1|nr:disulfide bond formation protein B [Aquabacterium sp.]HQC97627.1 disulfide bond formation protein B [Aquabacterium sp.]